MRKSIGNCGFVVMVSLFLALIPAASPVNAAVDQVWVDGTYTPGSSGGHTWGVDAFTNIQAGIDAAAAGGTVDVAAGTYTEQLLITTSNLTVRGVAGAVVQSPDTLVSQFAVSGLDNKPILCVTGVTGVVIEGLTFDGLGKGNANYRFAGIAFRNAGGRVAGCEITAVRDTPPSGAQHGVGIYGVIDDGTNRTVEVNSCTVHDFQKTGIAINGSNATVLVQNCVVTGAGHIAYTGQNGIQVGYGANGQVISNHVSGVWYTGSDWGASGILGMNAGSLTVVSNVVTDCGGGLRVDNYSGVTSPVVVQDNNLSGNFLNTIWGCEDVTISGNHYDSSSQALWLIDTSNVLATNNTFNGNEYGLIIDGACDNVQIVDSELKNNTATGLTVEPYGVSPTNVSIQGCDLSGNALALENTTTNPVDASANYWGSATPDLATLISGPTSIVSYYADAALTQLLSFDVYVDDGFDGATPGWGEDHFATIQEGIDAAATGGTVDVAAGLYRERLSITKALSLIGATAAVNKNGYAVPADYAWDTNVESVILNPDPALSASNLVLIQDTHDVTFKGFVVGSLNALASSSNDQLLTIIPTSMTMTNIVIENNVIGPNTHLIDQDGTHGRMGLYIDVNNYLETPPGLTDSRIAGNKIIDCLGNGNNIFIWGAYYAYGSRSPSAMEGTVFEDNEISGSRRSGFEIAGGVSGLTIRDNYIHDNASTNGGPASDYLKYGHGITLIRGASDKLADATNALGQVNLTIEGNLIENNEKSGIYLDAKVESLTLFENVIVSNGWHGVLLDLEGRFWNNTFEPAPVPVDKYAIYDGASNIVASGNIFLGNGLSGVTVNGAPTNGFELDASANYWGAADGPTGVGAGTGDAIAGAVTLDSFYADIGLTQLLSFDVYVDD
ncbi:right-handed parallel beta-helix repeat-containing protein, partial [bacterium]|nr:right-handed parallel beta-helix repeat-containing protein [bacterium]